MKVRVCLTDGQYTAQQVGNLLYFGVPERILCFLLKPDLFPFPFRMSQYCSIFTLYPYLFVMLLLLRTFPCLVLSHLFL